MRILSVFGTRPEAIKMAPVVKELAKRPNIESRVAVTAQHREMLDQVLNLFGIVPDHDLNIMRHGQTLSGITSAVLTGIEEIFASENPDLVLVHGDTTTTFAAALAAFYARSPCGHVEAGLRTSDKSSPFPEEVNRRLSGVLADYHFAPTLIARFNLVLEKVPAERIVVTGNTVIDALLETVKKDCNLADYGLGGVDWSKKVILLTCHRRESWGAPMRNIFAAVQRIVHDFADVELVFPVHKNPLIHDLAHAMLGGEERVHLIEPLEYLPFCHLMNNCYLVLTDSGGMQEEAPALGKPVLVLREVTERPEAIEAGTARLVGNDGENLYEEVKRLLRDEAAYAAMAKAANPFGDGTAAVQIADAIEEWFKDKNNAY